MKIAVIGANGGAGSLIARKGVQRGHRMVAVARRPEAIDWSDPLLEVRQADVFDVDSLRLAVAGCEAVICALGAGGPFASRKAAGLLSKGYWNLIRAMELSKVERLVAISSVGTVDDPHEELFYRYVLKPIIKPYYDDMAKMEMLIQTTRLSYTIVRPPYLTNKREKGNYRTAVGGNVVRGYRLSRSDLAAFCIDEVEADRHLRKIVGIAN